MTNMLRVKTRWSGLVGLPGYTIFHFRDFASETGWEPVQTDAQAAVDKVRVFFDAIKSYIPTGASLQVEGTVEQIEDTTNTLVDLWSATQPAVVLGTASASANYAAPVGGVVNWRTNVIRGGRRVRGRTFLVPLSSTAFQTDGSIANVIVTAIQTAAATLADGASTPDLGVYARPERVRDVNGNYTGEVLPNGLWCGVSGVTVPDLAAVLRSRRD